MSVGIVVIGRNEGERLRACLRSVTPGRGPVVYVDSGSTDGSPALAREMGVRVVALDLGLPFTAARARNAGWRPLIADHPATTFIQFVDGDCEIQPQWFDTAVRHLTASPETVAVCGRRRERRPDATIYNRLCDQEWDTPVGEADACGGDAMVRVSALKAVGGYRDGLIAGEEPDLCVRLRERGGKIMRLDAEMTLHDAAMTLIGQWRKRHVRAGHAFAEISAIHRHSPCRIWARATRSNWFWGVVVPVAAVGPAYWTFGVSLALLLGYPLLFAKISLSRRNRGDDAKSAIQYAWYCVLSKFPQAWGQLVYAKNRLFRRRTRLIEYKSAGPSA